MFGIPNPVMEEPVRGLTPTFPVIIVGPVLVIPAYDRIANPPVKPRFTGEGDVAVVD
jgi:hypothetical protein